MMKPNEPYYLGILQSELARRVSRNSNYSLRAYARALGLDPSTLSRILSSKQDVSGRAAEQICAKLQMNEQKRRQFLNSVIEHRIEKQRSKLDCREIRNDVREIDAQSFQRVANLHALAILEMTLLDEMNSNGAKLDEEFIGRRLGIDVSLARIYLKELADVGLIRQVGDKWVKTHLRLTTADKTSTSDAHREQQRQLLKAALESLEKDPLEIRSMTSMVMAVDPSKIPAAKKRIQQFVEELCDFLEDGPRTAIYELGVQLFPLEKVLKQ